MLIITNVQSTPEALGTYKLGDKVRIVFKMAAFTKNS